jgi:hypothetical protein
MANTFLGKAQVAGTSGTLTINAVALSPLKEGMDLNHEFEEDIIKDEQGNDAAWRAFNEKYMGDIKMRIVHTATDGTSTKANAKLLAAALVPYAIVRLTGCDIATWNNVNFQVISGGSIGLVNTSAGSMTYKLRRYTDPAQDTLAGHTPV